MTSNNLYDNWEPEEQNRWKQWYHPPVQPIALTPTPPRHVPLRLDRRQPTPQPRRNIVRQVIEEAVRKLGYWP